MAPGVSGQGTRGQGGQEADQGPRVTWVTRHEEGFEAGERLRLVSVDRSLAQD